jgi:hypothetical protein
MVDTVPGDQYLHGAFTHEGTAVLREPICADNAFWIQTFHRDK